MKFSEKICLKIILKVTKNQGFTLSLEEHTYLTLDKPKLLGNAFMDSQFNYVPLI